MAFMGFADTVGTFATGPYTVTRRDETTVNAHGESATPAPTTFPIMAFVEPIDSPDLQRLPEGQRLDVRMRLYTTTRLRNIGAPDRVVIDGDTWEVEKEDPWGALLSDYYVYEIARVP